MRNAPCCCPLTPSSRATWPSWPTSTSRAGWSLPRSLRGSAPPAASPSSTPPPTGCATRPPRRPSSVDGPTGGTPSTSRPSTCPCWWSTCRRGGRTRCCPSSRAGSRSSGSASASCCTCRRPRQGRPAVPLAPGARPRRAGRVRPAALGRPDQTVVRPGRARAGPLVLRGRPGRGGGVSTPLRNVAVVLAGGTGTRVGLSIPKQLIKIAGKPIIEHTIAAHAASPLVDEILVLMAPGYLDEVRAIVRGGGYDKVSQILEGAGTRNDTTATALAALGDQECNVLLHDAVRPLVSQTIIAANVEALQHHQAVDTAIPSADTVIQVGAALGRRSPTCSPGTCCAAARPRSRSGSPPSASAYALAAQDPDFTATDDCTVVLRYLPDVADRRRPRARAQHEGHRADRRLHRRQAVPADLGRHPGRADRRAVPRRPRRAGPSSSSAAPTASAADIADLARRLRRRRAHLLPLQHRHPRRAPGRRGRRRRRGAGRDRPDRLRRQHRRRAAARRAGRDQRGDDLRLHRRQLPGADLHRPGVPAPPGGQQRLAAAVHLVLLHPRPLRATRSTPRPRRRWST